MDDFLTKLRETYMMHWRQHEHTTGAQSAYHLHMLFRVSDVLLEVLPEDEAASVEMDWICELAGVKTP